MNEMTNSIKVKCKRCHAVILQKTAENTGSICMPCFKTAHSGRTPHNLKYIADHGLGVIEARWQSFFEKPFPAGIAGGDIAGVCPVSLDSSVAGCIDSALRVKKGDKILDSTRLSILRSSVADLRVVIDNLLGEQQEYFCDLLWMAETIIDACDRA
jgi:hypothetical protein